MTLNSQNQSQSHTETVRNYIQQMKDGVQSCKDMFAFCFPTLTIPPDSQFMVWMRRHKDVNLIYAALERTADWFEQSEGVIAKLKTEGKGVPAAMRKTQSDILSYASGVMIRMERGEDGHGAPVTSATPLTMTEALAPDEDELA